MKTLEKMLKPTLTGILFVTMIFGSYTIAQPGPDRLHKEKKEKIKAQKVAFITNKLNLSPEKAQLFWPVYNEAEASMEKEMKDFRENYDIRNIDLDELSEDELIAVADNYIIHRQKMNDIGKVYHTKFKSVLSPKQLILLYYAEKQFKLVLLKQIRDHQRQAPSHRR